MFTRPCFSRDAAQSQKLECDVEALREQVRDTMKHVRVVEWLKDNVKSEVLPYKAASGSQQQEQQPAAAGV
jgi:hypothetical protein